MKNILVFLFSILSVYSVYGQSTEKPFIEVRGMAKIERTVKSYTLDIVITEELAYLEEKKPFEEVKKAFFERVKAAGLDASRFKEDKLAFALTQYSALGSQFSFETRDPADIIKLSNLMVDKNGTQSITARKVNYLPVKDFSKVIAAAFADGKARAEKVAAAIGKKLGALQTVVDYSTTNDEVEDTAYYQPKDDRYYYLSLKYHVE
ncbi:SIMPL domain-containing protein [Sphingobacterium detergens]|uniref:DUF541 domain-containing protein n=1 Tax=Sphingobacterium detergens TaxID=1145106 RepID=A0A420BGH6_SPHD1|nr:SIMPL domain-containing protein [Sphingobacterium detergens]RKE55813.1 hypothetical protein DFQ12_0652 [Sphingobacterium detergens]